MWVAYWCDDYDGTSVEAWENFSLPMVKSCGVQIGLSYIISPSECYRYYPTETICPW